MPLILHHADPSPPSRAVRMTAAALGLELQLKEIDLKSGEQNSEAFLKLNPAHQVPLLDDNGFLLSESRAIQAYLVNKYAKNDALYPKDPVKRALVDRLLHFDNGTLFNSGRSYMFPVVFLKQEPNPEAAKKIQENLSILESYVKGPYLTGDGLTIADLSLLATVLAARDMGMDFSEVPKTQAWLQKLTMELPYFKEVNEKGLAAFQELVRTSGLNKNA